jgi:hypothetical protein
LNPPGNPKIFHITPIERLRPILSEGGLQSDSQIALRNDGLPIIGMGKLKQKRMVKLVTSDPSDTVASYVPFYFSPRSVMLNKIQHNNNPADRDSDLEYTDGQKKIIHLQADLRRVVAWADENSRKWHFSLGNASADYTEFRDDLSRINDLNWAAINARYWSECRDQKQAEFLLKEFFPFELFEGAGVMTLDMKMAVESLLAPSAYRVPVKVLPSWYY